MYVVSVESVALEYMPSILNEIFFINCRNELLHKSFHRLRCSRRGNGQGYHVDLALYMLTHVLFFCGFPGSGKWSTP